MDPQTKESQYSKQPSLLQVRQMAYLPADHFPQGMLALGHRLMTGYLPKEP
jgi:hypothetical protein